MFKTLTVFVDRLVQRYLPDAFLFAIILTLIVYVLGVGFTPSSPMDMVIYWGDGFWELLTFAMQMSLVVVTGYILASTPFVEGILARTAQLAKTSGQAIILVTIVAAIANLINYGFGLVVGALFARHLIRVVPTVDYRLLVASAYSGYLIWHGGLSGSVPLAINTPGHFAEDLIGLVPITETLLSSYNIFIVVSLFITLPILNRFLLTTTDGPGQIGSINERVMADDPNDKKENEEENKEKMTPAERIENSMIISMLIGLLGFVFIIRHFALNGLDLNINVVNFVFLFSGIILHGTPRRFLDTVTDGVKNAGGIIVQFPFYAGIMGMMGASGLSEQVSLWFVNISNEFTFPLLTFISAGVVNFFVPSGGGQWAVQGPIMISAALELGVDTAKTAMAVAWGDAWTNMIQPFWTLPLLAIAGLKVRDILGFCMIVLIWGFIPISIGILFF